MSEAHFDEFEHYNFDQDKAMRSGHSGKQNFLNQNLLNINKNLFYDHCVEHCRFVLVSVDIF